MLMSQVNDVKIYNLSGGKSLPNWLSERKREKIAKSNAASRRGIELIQDFEMPDECQTIHVSPDAQYILATGTYKPRVKCFEVNNLSIKFERCFDSEVVATQILSEDYGKVAFLMCDRFVEIHASHGRHYRLRIPRCGYDLSYHLPTCDLYLVGASPHIYRLNLERGQFLNAYETNAKHSVNAIDVNPEHYLLCAGTQEGTIEAWDPRERQRCATLDVGLSIPNLNQLPAITSIKFKNGLQMGVGTDTGHILIYDIRSNTPLVIKDHHNELPIKRIEFNLAQNCVYTLDSAIFKIWDESNGQQIAYIESESKFNDFCTIPGSGLMFFAQQSLKMLSYYMPQMGPAPKWCSFLDNLTEEIESETIEAIYDDYKFITRQELNALGLDHLEGTNLLRAYMHGFFIDIRLYNKARTVAEPFSFDKYRKEKIRQQIEATRPSRLKIKTNLPKVNQELSLKYMNMDNKRKKKDKHNLLDDDRFKEMFENPAYEVDKNAMEYKMLTPVLNRLDKSKVKELKQKAMEMVEDDDDDNDDGKSTDDDLFSERDSSSDDEDERIWTKEVKDQYKKIRKENSRRRDEEKEEEEDNTGDNINEPKMIPLNQNEFKVKTIHSKSDRFSLGDRLNKDDGTTTALTNDRGNRQISFKTGKVAKDIRQREYELKKHREERRKVIRSTASLRLKKLPTI